MNELYRQVKCPDCCWWKFKDGEAVGMTPCPKCNSTGYIYEPVGQGGYKMIEEAAKRLYEIAYRVREFAIKHPNSYMPDKWDDLTDEIKANYYEEAQQISRLFNLTEEVKVDKIEDVKKILERYTMSWYREDKEWWINIVAQKIDDYYLQPFEPEEEEPTVKLPYGVGLGGEANDEPKPDGGRLLSWERIRMVFQEQDKKGQHDNMFRMEALCQKQRDLTVSRRRKE